MDGEQAIMPIGRPTATARSISKYEARLDHRHVRHRKERGCWRTHQKGLSAVDLDAPDWSEWVDVGPADQLTPAEGKDWIWREDRVRALLSKQDQGLLFVSGCAENMQRLFPLIETVILLSAPAVTIMERLEARSSDGYGSTDGERRKVGELIATIEPLLRQSADHEIDSSGPPSCTVDRILKAI